MNNKYLITNKVERKRVIGSVIFLLIAISGVFLMLNGNYLQSGIISYRTLRGFRELTGQIAAWGFAFSISMFAVRRVIKNIDTGDIKKRLLAIARFTREWHVPISIAALSIIFVHVYLILSSGFILDVRYISGLAAFAALVLQLISGIFRYKRKAIKLHMVQGLTFILLIAVHLISK